MTHFADDLPNTDQRPAVRLIRRLSDSIHAGIFLTFVGSFLGYAGSVDFRLDLFSHFRLIYAVALGAGSLLALIQRRRRLAGLWALGFCVNGIAIVPLFLPVPTQVEAKAAGSTLRVLSINVLRENGRKSSVIDAIRQADPDLFVAVELDSDWLLALNRSLADRWPHLIAEPRGDAFGIALFSKHPLENGTIFESPGSYAPSIRGEIRLHDSRLAIFGTHPFPPVSPFIQNAWVAHMDDLAARIQAETVPVIAIGDFNTTPWSENYRRFRTATGLVDTMQGFGPQSSWPSVVPWFGLPIDHVMTSAGIRTLNRRVGPFVGSDHLPVKVELVVPDR